MLSLSVSIDYAHHVRPTSHYLDLFSPLLSIRQFLIFTNPNPTQLSSLRYLLLQNVDLPTIQFSLALLSNLPYNADPLTYPLRSPLFQKGLNLKFLYQVILKIFFISVKLCNVPPQNQFLVFIMSIDQKYKKKNQSVFVCGGHVTEFDLLFL